MLDIVRVICEDLKVDQYFFSHLSTYEPMIQFYCICWRPYFEQKVKKYICLNLRIHDAICQQCLLYIYLCLFYSILN